MALLIALWAIPGIIGTSQIYLIYGMGPMPISFLDAATWQMPPYLYWALATPLILYVATRFPLERRVWPGRVAIHLLLNALLCVPHLSIAALTGRLAGQKFFFEHPFAVTVWHLFTKNVHLELLLYWGVVAIAHALSYRRAWQERKVAAAQLETRLVSAQLEALKMQLHPHFLFNTLNAVAVLVRKQDTQGAVKMLAGLSDLLRLALETTGRQLVPLKQELDVLDRYLEIERIRFQDRLTVVVDVVPEALGAQVPNLILQPIVENALRHGIAPRAAAGRVELRAWREGDRLVITVADDGVGLRPDWTPGLGLGNARARLEQLYPGRFRLAVEPASQSGGTTVTLEMPFEHE